MRRITLLIVFGLIAASCGGGESTATDRGPGDVSQTTNAVDSPAPAGAAPAGQEPGQPATTTEGTDAVSDLPASDYPAVVVADLAGGDFNLKELVLEEEPVLLWFWAPH